MDENTVSATLKEIDCIIVRWIQTCTTQTASLQHCYRRFVVDDVKISSLEIGLYLFLLTYSTMLIDMSGAFTMSEADVSQTEGNVQILHLELNYFCI